MNNTSASAPLVLLELPDKPSDGLKALYALEPASHHALTLRGKRRGAFELAAVLLSNDGHYTAAVRDGGASWLLFDAMLHDGVGMPVEPPTGTCGDYFPVGVVYRRCSAADEDWAM